MGNLEEVKTIFLQFLPSEIKVGTNIIAQITTFSMHSYLLLKGLEYFPSYSIHKILKRICSNFTIRKEKQTNKKPKA